ncbi:bactericidal permeability-increasing protein [Amia ocellicauda]|uniref:bactericidal permeability-increasing protein n=1 Tax=Amia ocellicauda TaxID=2972642 RepID=UPI0034639B13
MPQWWLLSLLALCHLSHSSNPAITLRLTRRGMNYGRNVGMNILRRELLNMKIPPLSGTLPAPVIGNIHFRISRSRVQRLDLGSTSADMIPDRSIKLSIRNANIKIGGDWWLKYLWNIEDWGTYELSISKITISATIVFAMDNSGRPTVSSASCNSDISDVSFSFYGGASWLYNLFTGYINSNIQSNLQRQICPDVTRSIYNLNSILRTLNTKANADKYAGIDYSMVMNPRATSNYIDLNLNGQFYNNRKYQEPPLSPPYVYIPYSSSSMLYIAMSEYTANTAGFVYFSTGQLYVDITDYMIPRSSLLRLNTKSILQLIMPEIADQLPAYPIKLQIKANRQPSVTFQPNNITLQVFGSITAALPGTTLGNLFILNVTASVDVKIQISAIKLFGRTSLNRMRLSFGSDYIELLKVLPAPKILRVDKETQALNIARLIELLQPLLEQAVQAIVMPMVNAQLSNGFPLPSFSWMQFVNPQLQVKQSYILIGTDAHYTG